jgi:glutamine cyclotransferase
MTDGSDQLTFRDPESFRVLSRVSVTTPEGRRMRSLNELECVDGHVYANVWQSDRILRIDPATGHVTAIIDASGLLERTDPTGDEDVLNGIAYRPDNGHFLLTGKLWSKVFEVSLVPASSERERGAQ